MRASLLKSLFLLFLFIPTQVLLAQAPDSANVNYGMTKWHDYGFQSIPKEIFDQLERENYKRAIFKLRRYMNKSDGRINPEAWLLSARALLNVQNYKVAHRTAQRVMGYFPNHPEMLAVISLSYLYGRNAFDYARTYAKRTADACDDCTLSKHLFRLIELREEIRGTL